ncbi:hypothetical protein Q3G72_012244 [Acer saccharum]|nr:hypothetical protein Q3G72_012244 [Acer saccharum]
MESKISLLSWLLLLTFSLFISQIASQDNRQAYIVYMGSKPEGQLSTSALHMSMLRQVAGRNFGPESLLYHYGKSFDGFVVKLTEEEAKKMAGMSGVVSVFPNRKLKLHTTRSWDFMGFSQKVERATTESDVIIGVIDTGIWPESESFNDTGFGPPPTKWRGTCKVSANFTCNNKIIGAKYYRSDGRFGPDDIPSPRDSNGHGTHTASTAAGNLVSMTSLYSFGQGTARGGVPSSRIAVYKVCWSDGCWEADTLAAFDDAIADGVDIISISIGHRHPLDYFNDSKAIGSFHAMRNGILTSFSAGNEGPKSYTISNIAPWFLSVAASTIDRNFSTKVQLGNNIFYEGISINTVDLTNTKYPLIYGGDAPNVTGGFSNNLSRFCNEDSLDRNLVKGKIVLCDRLVSGKGPFYAGAVGTVIQDTVRRDYARNFPLPTSYVNEADGRQILTYIKSNSNTSATIFKSTQGNDTKAPYVVSFSSRGPNPITLDILKPDITAPGVNILAAWTPLNSVSEVKGREGSPSRNVRSFSPPQPIARPFRSDGPWRNHSGTMVGQKRVVQDNHKVVSGMDSSSNKEGSLGGGPTDMEDTCLDGTDALQENRTVENSGGSFSNSVGCENVGGMSGEAGGALQDQSSNIARIGSLGELR